jgi:hypothetical protein
MLRFFVQLASFQTRESFKVPLIAQSRHVAFVDKVRYKNHVGTCITPCYKTRTENYGETVVDDLLLRGPTFPRPAYMYVPTTPFDNEGKSC